MWTAKATPHPVAVPRIKARKAELILDLCHCGSGAFLSTQLRVTLVEAETQVVSEVPWLIGDGGEAGELVIGSRTAGQRSSGFIEMEGEMVKVELVG